MVRIKTIFLLFFAFQALPSCKVPGNVRTDLVHCARTDNIEPTRFCKSFSFNETCYLWKMDKFGNLGIRNELDDSTFLNLLVGKNYEEIIKLLGKPDYLKSGAKNNSLQIGYVLDEYAVERAIDPKTNELDIKKIWEFSSFDIYFQFDSLGLLVEYFYSTS